MAGVDMVGAWLADCAAEFSAHADELDALDRLLGDGDHGANMLRGTESARLIDLNNAGSAAAALRKVGMALVSTVGGASGPLFGTFFLRTGAAWPRPVSTPGLARAVRAGLDGVVLRGRAEAGDKTMVDALAPAVESLEESAAAGEVLNVALPKAAAAAERGRDATRDMVAKRGRAALKADSSVGVIDPGAVSVAIIFRTAAKHIR